MHVQSCVSCGHVGCCDDAPNRHGTAHFRASRHLVIQSFEPGDDWWCYLDEIAFAADDRSSLAHP